MNRTGRFSTRRPGASITERKGNCPMSSIESCRALEILDSRGNPTLAVTVRTKDGRVGKAAVPSGASTGEREAVELRDHDSKRYGGKGVLKAAAHVNGPLNDLLKGKPVFDQEAIDRAMI